MEKVYTFCKGQDDFRQMIQIEIKCDSFQVMAKRLKSPFDICMKFSPLKKFRSPQIQHLSFDKVNISACSVARLKSILKETR